MSNVSSWSTTATSNDSASPNGAPEDMAPSGVNDTIRENMAAVARLYADLDGTQVTTGAGNAYVLTTSSTHAALADQALLAFRADRANTGAATLNVDGLGAKSLVYRSQALVSGDITANSMMVVSYNSSSDQYDVVGGIAVEEGTFTGTLTGFTATLQGTIKWRRDGQAVTLGLDALLTGTSNTNAMTMTGLTAALQPAQNRRLVTEVTNGSLVYPALVLIQTSGTLVFSPQSSTSNSFSTLNFQTSSSKGLQSGWSITYQLSMD